MTMTLSDLDRSAARAACPFVDREYRMCRKAAEGAADRFHLAVERVIRQHERGLATDATKHALTLFRSAYATLDDIRDQLDREGL